MVVYDARAEQRFGEPFHPSLEMTFRGHRQSVLAVDLQPSPTPTSSSSLLSHHLPRQSATHDDTKGQDGYKEDHQSDERHGPVGTSLLSYAVPSSASRRRDKSAQRGRASPSHIHSSSLPPPPRMLTGGADGAVMLWDAKPTVRALRFLGHQGPVLGCAFSPPELTGYGAPSLGNTNASHNANLLLASCGHDGYIRLWVPNLRRTSSTYPARGSYQVNGYKGKANGTSFLRSSTRSTGVAAGVLGDWHGASSADAESVSAWRAHTGAARAIAFARDGSAYLYSVGDDKSLKCWDLTYASGPAAVPQPPLFSSGGAFTAGALLSAYPYANNTLSSTGVCDGNYAYGTAAGSRNRFVAGYGGASGHTNWVRCLAVQGPYTSSSFFHYIASGGDDGCIRIWDSRTRSAAHVFYEPQASVRGLDFHPDGYCLASGDVRGNVNIFDLRQSTSSSSDTKRRKWHGLLQHYGTAHDGAVNAVSFARNGGWLLSCGEDGLVKLWDVKEGFLYCTMQAHEAAVKACRFDDSGAYFASGGADKVAMLWRSGLPRHGLEATTPIPTDVSPATQGEEEDGGSEKGETRAGDEQAWYDEVAEEHRDPNTTQASGGSPHHNGEQPSHENTGNVERDGKEPQAVPCRAVSWQDEVGRRPPPSPGQTGAVVKREKLVRSEERYSELRDSPSQPPEVVVKSEQTSTPRQTSRTPARNDNEGEERGHSVEQTPEAHAPHKEHAETTAVAHTDELPRRVARLEAAIEQLASMVQGQQAAQESELLALREVNHERQEQHHSEVVELKGMLQSLITQQEHFLRQLASSKGDTTAA